MTMRKNPMAVMVPLVAVLTLFPETARSELDVGKIFQECEQCPEMVVVPSGRYPMGKPTHELGWAHDGYSVHPVRQVSIPEAFAVSRHEVTFAEWDACVAQGGCDAYRPDDMGWGRGHRPVINVSWTDAKAFVDWLGNKTGHPYRLLSESEWEYVARAGTLTAFHTGDRITTDEANFNGTYTYNGSSQGIFRKQTIEVGSFPANGYDLHDMHGNVSEWVEDCFQGGDSGTSSDGTARITGDCTGRVLRGGSWTSDPWFVRSANRVRSYIEVRNHNTGFRVARTLGP
ncbi:MAG: formylglycine-generating enzyme family protein [Gammaproteobacteria bacterium]|nr:formylglycine-generating enzyme family protein [Gammaproteobacteria bacterium]